MLQLVFAHITDDDIHVQHRALASVCRSCRAFSRLASPLLYRFLSLDYNEQPKLRLILRTLMEKPVFGLEVKVSKVT